jgi:serine/threonine protein kinase
MRHNEELKQRLTEEARAASALDHPNIVVIYEIDETPDGDLFIDMAFHEGATLGDRIGRDKTTAALPVAEVLQIARQIASGLSKAHERGIFHRDIKPSNVIVAKDGVDRIIDFALAKSMEATVTLDGSSKKTPLYMSPEQASGQAVDFRTDLWSLGAVLYEMLPGRPPFRGDSQL